MSLNGMVKDKVYFSKKNDNGKTDTKAVDWKNRNKEDADGYRLIGVNVGLEKTINAEGKAVNDKKTLTPYDACDYIKDYLMDDSSVFIKGNLEFSSFMDSEGNIRRSVKYVPGQISLCKEVKFDEYSEENKPSHDFTQNIVFMGIDKERIDDKETNRFIVSAKIVTYNDIVDTEFVMTDSKLAGVFRKNLKPYTSIKVWGNISVEKDTTEVETTDCWGAANSMERVNTPTIRELIITGADPETIDTTTYTEAEIDKAIETAKASKNAEKDFGNSTDGWGSVGSSADDEDDAGW
jgi:hypothetical protein